MIDRFELAQAFQACELVRHPGRVLGLMFESVLKPPNEPHPGKSNDPIMLVVAPRGKRANRSEFRYLLREAGFSLMRGIPKAGAPPIIGSQPA